MRPGKAAASPTSRPVIVKHNPELKNTQVAVSGIGERDTLLDPKKKVGVVPAGAPTVAQAAEAPVADPAATATAPIPAPVVPAEEPKKSSESEQEDSPVQPLPEASIDMAATAIDNELAEAPSAPATPAVSAPQPIPAAPGSPAPHVKPLTAAELATATAEVANMRMPGEAPIIETHAHESHLVRNIVLAAVLVVLALIAVDILLDAAVLPTNAVPHTHFFN